MAREMLGASAAFPALAARVQAQDAATVLHRPGEPAMSSIIPDRAEFIDALRVLRRGHVLVRVHTGSGGCMIDGAPVYRSFDTLMEYGLIREFENPVGFAGVRYYRLSDTGREFADRACTAWRQRPLIERLAVRFAG
jgi:hypothetical protein